MQQHPRSSFVSLAKAGMTSSKSICALQETWDVPASDLLISTVLKSYGAPAAPPVEKPLQA